MRIPYKRAPVGDILSKKFPPVGLPSPLGFVHSLSRVTQRRGESYFKSGAVRSLKCVEKGVHYRAKVQGSQLYTVDLQFDDGVWIVDCSCPVGEDCKHGVAAMLELLSNRAPKEASPSVESRPVKVASRPRAEPLPARSSSPLEHAVANALKRPLSHTERQFV